MSPSPASFAPSAAPDLFAGLADRLDPPKVDVFAALGYEPTPRQQVFHDATEFDVLYGGAAGGGKTKALLMHAIRACIAYPGIVVAAFRRSYPELEESLIAELMAVNAEVEALGGRYISNKHDLRFTNGSIVRFRYAESVEDATRRQGSEIQLLIVDERTQVVDGVVGYLATRLRSSNPRIPVLGIRSGSNPGGKGHGAVKERFVVATAYGTQVAVDEARPERRIRFVPAKLDDNPHLNAEYEADLNAIADEALRAALRDGNWDTFAGQYFPQWNRTRHVVAPFKLPASWHRFSGIDWGYAAPWAVLWGTVDEDRRLWIYRELYETEVGETDQAKRILKAEGGEKVRLRLADPSMWNRRGEVNPIAQVYIQNGCVVTPATNDRISGWQRIHTYLAEAPACRLHREMGWETCPGVHVFENCTELIRTLPALPRDLTNPEDVDTDAEDHAADALRYLAMQLPVRPPSPPKEPEDVSPEARLSRTVKARRKPARHKNHPQLGRR